jgi:hypothetical protein
MTRKWMQIEPRKSRKMWELEGQVMRSASSSAAIFLRGQLAAGMRQYFFYSIRRVVHV